MRVRHPNRADKHGHNTKACGLCQPHKRHDPKFDERERAVRREVRDAQTG